MTAAVAATGSDFAAYVLPILVLPLATAVVLLLFGKRLSAVGRAGRPHSDVPGLLATAAMAGAFLASLLLFTRLLGLEAEAGDVNGRSVTVHLFDWIVVGGFQVGADLLVDQLSAVMALVVTGVGTLITLYSVDYMHGDERYERFFAYMTLFAASMLLLVLADNLVLLYVGWEAVGLCSYLLIGFWFERPAAHNAAKKAFLVNRIGDFSFLIGIFVLAATVGTVTVGSVNLAAQTGAIGAGMATVAALLLFGGATGKSAQIPLYVWLPDAMEGPTPASALIHAATMVTAGVYMVARFSPVFAASSGDIALTVVAWVGALTALLAAVLATFQYDIKRVLAYSTISQIGYMFLANGLGAYSAGIFHLTTHAFFKALMFMGAGAVMHSLAGEVDLRKMGGLRKVMPITGLTFAAGWLAISGIVPFSGFFSKDAILAVAWEEGEFVLWSLGVVTALITAFYMSRLYFRVFEGDLVVPEGAHPHEAPRTMAIPLVVLGGLAVVGGVINLPGVVTLEHFLEPALGGFEVPSGAAAWLLASGALLIGGAGIAAARYVYLTPAGADLRRRLRRGSWLERAIDAARNRFYVDELYGDLIVLPGKDLALFSAYKIDARVIDGAVNAAGSWTASLADVFRRIQSGYVRSYALTFLLGAVLFLSFVVLRVIGGAVS